MRSLGNSKAFHFALCFAICASALLASCSLSAADVEEKWGITLPEGHEIKFSNEDIISLNGDTISCMYATLPPDKIASFRKKYTHNNNGLMRMDLEIKGSKIVLEDDRCFDNLAQEYRTFSEYHHLFRIETKTGAGFLDAEKGRVWLITYGP